MTSTITNPGDISQDALRHLLDFARVDLADLQFHSLEETRRTIAVIAAQVGRLSPRKRLVHSDQKAWQPEIETQLSWGVAPVRARTLHQLTELQTILNGCLNALFPPSGFGDLPGASTEFPVRANRLHVQRLNAGPAAPVEVWFVAEEWRDAFWLSTVALLEEYGRKLHRCPVCAAVYFKVRRKKYCSPECSNRRRQADYYKAHRKQLLTALRRKRQTGTR